MCVCVYVLVCVCVGVCMCWCVYVLVCVIKYSPSDFRSWDLSKFIFPHNVCYMPRPIYCLLFDLAKNMWPALHTAKLLIMHFSSSLLFPPS